MTPRALAQDQPRQAFLIDVPGVSFEELLGVPEVLDLARAGGAGLMRVLDPVEPYPPYPQLVPGDAPITQWEMDPDAMGGLDRVGATIRERVEGAGGDEVLVIVMSRTGSAEMAAAKDELHPIVMAVGAPDELFDSEGAAGSLTSDTTRRAGVATDLDVPPTLAPFLDAEPPAGSEGSAIRIVGDEPAPFDLHERYLAQRRLFVPIGTAAAIYVTVVGLLGAASVWLGDRVPETARRAIGWACLSAAATGTALLAVGHLLQLTYAAAVPFVAIVSVFGTMAFSPLERRGVVWVPAGIGAGVLGYFVLEALLGWDAMLTPLLGGTHLDGGRFYGLPNVAIGLLVGASLWLAQRLRTWSGVALVAGIALAAGMPYLGSNLGAGVTLSATAGLWLAVRERERLGIWKAVGVVALAAAAGTALLLLAHAVSPLPTHVTRFEETAGGLAAVWDTLVDRLGVGVDLIRRNPAALVPVVGLLASLAVALRPPAAIAATFERWPAWRDAIVVCLLAGIVAYVANDTGAAAAGFAFGLGLGGMLGVSLLAGPGKMMGP
ncbi:MAG TPA: hypothetical protein VFZ96_06785 [Actinomycetota bacterium]|nr:hypothetical protein [Actinomycetota bacterium]